MDNGVDPFLDVTSLTNLEMETVWQRYNSHKNPVTSEAPSCPPVKHSGTSVVDSFALGENAGSCQADLPFQARITQIQAPVTCSLNPSLLGQVSAHSIKD